jgi:hypothetical protein
MLQIPTPELPQCKGAVNFMIRQLIQITGTVSFGVVCVLLLSGCAPAIREFYPDTYFEADRIYQNKSLGFTLTYRGNWLITTDPNKMSKTIKPIARSFAQSSAEFLFVGSTVEGLYGTRGIVNNLNLPPNEYAELVRNQMLPTVTADSGITTVILKNGQMIQWRWTVNEYQFVEYYFVIDTYDIRIAFWSKKETFERFLPVYEDIISSIETIGKY